jgi:iron complex transport system ATP-binding protein
VVTFAFTVEAVVLMGRTAHGNLFSQPTADGRAIAAFPAIIAKVRK